MLLVKSAVDTRAVELKWKKMC